MSVEAKRLLAPTPQKPPQVVPSRQPGLALLRTIGQDQVHFGAAKNQQDSSKGLFSRILDSVKAFFDNWVKRPFRWVGEKLGLVKASPKPKRETQSNQPESQEAERPTSPQRPKPQKQKPPQPKPAEPENDPTPPPFVPPKPTPSPQQPGDLITGLAPAITEDPKSAAKSLLYEGLIGKKAVGEGTRLAYTLTTYPDLILRAKKRSYSNRPAPPYCDFDIDSMTVVPIHYPQAVHDIANVGLPLAIIVHTNHPLAEKASISPEEAFPENPLGLEPDPQYSIMFWLEKKVAGAQLGQIHYQVRNTKDFIKKHFDNNSYVQYIADVTTLAGMEQSAYNEAVKTWKNLKSHDITFDFRFPSTIFVDDAKKHFGFIGLQVNSQSSRYQHCADNSDLEDLIEGLLGRWRNERPWTLIERREDKEKLKHQMDLLIQKFETAAKNNDIIWDSSKAPRIE